MTPADVTVAVGATEQLVVSFVPETTTEKGLKFTAKDPLTVSVSSDGLVKGMQAGQSAITVASTAVPSLTKEIPVTVTA